MRKILTLIILLSCLSTFAIKEQKHIQPENKNVQFGVQVPKKEFIFEIDSLEIARKFYVCDTLMQPTDSMATLFRYGKYHTISLGSTLTESDPIFVASIAHGITQSDINNWNAKLGSLAGAWLINDTIVTLASKNFIETWITNRFQPIGSYVTGTPWTGMGYLNSTTGWVKADTATCNT